MYIKEIKIRSFTGFIIQLTQGHKKRIIAFIYLFIYLFIYYLLLLLSRQHSCSAEKKENLVITNIVTMNQ